MAREKYVFTEQSAAKMLELSKEGYSQKMMFAELGISKGIVERLKKEDELFVETLDMAVVNSQAFWEKKILDNVDNKNFNSRLVEIVTRAQFQDDYRETREPKNVKVDVVVDFAGAVKELITELKAAGAGK